MILKDLIQGIRILELSGRIDLEISQITTDSTEVIPNSLFLCVEGTKTDGHLYLTDALTRGAVAVVSERSLSLAGVTCIKVPSVREAVAQMAIRFYQNPAKDLTLIGVTGTNGKSSITYMLKAVLEQAGRKTGLIGGLGILIDKEKISTERTTPDAITLQQAFNTMVKKGVSSCVMEVSSHALSMHRVDGLLYNVGIFTNLTPDHLDYHENMEAYLNAKKKLFYQTTQGNIINLDDPYGEKLVEELKTLPIPLVTYGIEKPADYQANSIQLELQGVTFQVKGPDFQGSFTLKIPGLFAVYNGLAVIAAAHRLQIPLQMIRSALETFPGVKGRFEVIEEIKDRAVVVDFAHTPNALENVLSTARKVAKNRLITVFGCGGDRDRSKRPVMGKIAAKYSDFTIITSDNPRTEDPKAILEMIESGVKSAQGKYVVIEDRKEAIRFALRKSEKSDMILIAGKGHETVQIIGDCAIPFDDRSVALEIAREEGIQ